MLEIGIKLCTVSHTIDAMLLITVYYRMMFRTVWVRFDTQMKHYYETSQIQNQNAVWFLMYVICEIC
jgi:hypothetical protein